MRKIFAFFVLSLFFLFSFSQQQITITTYYPSPVGIYNKLMTKKLSVGDTNEDGNISSLDLPVLEGSIAFAPQSGDPSTWPAGKEGELAYSKDNKSFYYYNGSGWAREGEGPKVCISLKASWDIIPPFPPGRDVPPCPPGWEEENVRCIHTIAIPVVGVPGLFHRKGYCERVCCQ